MALSGVAFDDGDQRGPELFVAASEALRNAQTGGGDRVAVLAPSAAKEVMERRQLESDLRAAVAQREITLDYQPEYDITTGALVGFAALDPWHHPELGHHAPPVLLPTPQQP